MSENLPGSCDFCGKTEYMPFHCHRCGKKFCSDHRLPEQHRCHVPYKTYRHHHHQHGRRWQPRHFRQSNQNWGNTHTSYQSFEKPEPSAWDKISNFFSGLFGSAYNFAKTFLKIIIVLFVVLFIISVLFDSNTIPFLKRIEQSNFYEPINITKNITSGIISGVESAIVAQPTTESESRAAIDYINKLRTQNGVSTIKFDERAYELGLARAKDMYDNKYMDHTSPTGQCPDNMKSAYNFSFYEFLAENAYSVQMGGSSGSSKTVTGPDGRTHTYEYIDYSISKPDMQTVVNSWMNSRGHRFNLLYYSHYGGAFACYGGSCVFLGVNSDNFGQGCVYASDTVPFWNSVGPQPGER